MSLEARVPCCAACRAHKPRPCVYTDWISEHLYPWGGAIHHLQIQQAAKLTAWTPENLRELAKIRLRESEGFSEDGIGRIMRENHLDSWVLMHGISQAIKQHRINYTGGGFLHGGLFLETERSKQSYYVSCFFLPCPDVSKWTIMPVLVEYNNFHDNWREFMVDQFDEAKLVIGSADEWKSEWQKWWENNNISQADWEGNHKRFWYALEFRGRQPHPAVMQFMGAVQQQMLTMIESRLDGWQENPPLVIT